MKYEFDTVIRKHNKLNSGYIEFPYDIKRAFGRKNRVKVKALIDGYLYRGSLVKMGVPYHWMGITQKVRKAIGKNPGDVVHVVIEEDFEERTVEIPSDFHELMIESGVYDYFNRLSFTYRKEYVRWITDVKREETRQRRLYKAVEMLRNGIKTPFKSSLNA
ncbi:MAG: YdeI/OmpD-associated family protein [Bacteroidales bacterium]